MSAGRIIFLYFLIEILFPYLLIVISNVELVNYVLPGIKLIWILHLLIIFTLVKVFTYPVNNKNRQSEKRKYEHEFSFRTDIIITFLFIISIIGFFSGLGGWRYSQEGLSENLSTDNVFFVAIPVILEYFVFIKVFYAEKKKNFLLILSPKFRDLFIVTALFFSASGIGSMIFILIYIGKLIAPDFFNSIIYDRKQKRSIIKMVRNIILIPIFIGVGLFAFLYGESIKVGISISEVREYVFTKEYVKEFGPYIVERFSPSLVSLFIVLDKYAQDFKVKDNLKNIKEVSYNTLFRVSKILGGIGDISRPESGTIMRLNYEQIINRIPREREGTSPGLIPGFYMILPFPLAILFCAIYISSLIYIFSFLLKYMAGNLSIIGGVVALKFWGNFLASPIDIALLLDPITISIGLFVLFYFKLRKHERRLFE